MYARRSALTAALITGLAAPLLFADGEIAEGTWFTKDEVRAALELGDWGSEADAPLLLPGSISIARGMLESWVK